MPVLYEGHRPLLTLREYTGHRLRTVKGECAEETKARLTYLHRVLCWYLHTKLMLKHSRAGAHGLLEGKQFQERPQVVERTQAESPLSRESEKRWG